MQVVDALRIQQLEQLAQFAAVLEANVASEGAVVGIGVFLNADLTLDPAPALLLPQQKRVPAKTEYEEVLDVTVDQTEAIPLFEGN